MSRKLKTPVIVRWRDSYGVKSGWTERDADYKPSELIVESVGWVLSESDTMIALSHNRAKATTDTPMQDNGIMAIPKCAIIEIICLSASFCRQFE